MNRLSALALCLTLGACAHPENYRWNEESQPNFAALPNAPEGSRFGDWKDPSVSVYSFATPSPASGDASLKDLSDRGQAALIAAMTKDGAKPDEIRDALAKPLKAKAVPVEGSATVEGSYKRTLVANVTKGWSAKPGERLVWTWIYIKPLNFLFDGYSIIATDNQLLNIEQVTNATTAGVTANLGKTGSDTSITNTAGSPVSSVLQAVTGSSAGVSGNLSNVYTTTAAINQQYVKLGADILPKELRIYRESERNLDVAGNTLIALNLKLDPSKWEALSTDKTHRVTKLDMQDDDGKLRKLADLTFETSLNKAPPACALQAEVQLFYQARRVLDGRSYVEGEQTASYTQAGTGANAIEILPADEVRKPAWRIYTKGSVVALSLRDAFDVTNPIDFTSYEQAHNFAAWLEQNSSVTAGKDKVPIGKAGSVLVSGVTGVALSGGPYQARLYAEDKDKLAKACAATGGVVIP